MALSKAQFWIFRAKETEKVDVLFNPTDYEMESGNQYAEKEIAGLQTPLSQFTSGERTTLKLNLFLIRMKRALTFVPILPKSWAFSMLTRICTRRRPVNSFGARLILKELLRALRRNTRCFWKPASQLGHP